MYPTETEKPEVDEPCTVAAEWRYRYRSDVIYLPLTQAADLKVLRAMADNVGAEVRAIAACRARARGRAVLPPQELEPQWAAFLGMVSEGLPAADVLRSVRLHTDTALRLCGLPFPSTPLELTSVMQLTESAHAELLRPESEHAELLRLRQQVQQQANATSDLAMGASIKLAAARMVLSGLLKGNRLDSHEKAAIQGVFDMLPVPSTGHIAKADALAHEQQQKRIGGAA